MEQEPKVISINRGRGLRLDPTLTSEEAIILRALAAGKLDRQVCKDLGMAAETFLRMMRDIREKTSTTSDLSLREWAQQQINSNDRRIDKRESVGRPA
jgi:DNA-binding CsgD family transcriptional regulator